MTSREQSNPQDDRWDLLAQELLGESPGRQEAEEADDTAGAGPVDELTEPTEPAFIEAAPESEAPRESPKPETHEETPLQAGEAAPPTSEMESTETFVGAESEVPVEIVPEVSPTEAEPTNDVETLDEDVSAAEPSGELEQAGPSESPRDKPRRTRRGRRRRSRRASAEPAEAERESVEDDESQIDFEEATLPDDGEDEQLSAAEHAAKSKAIPTWAEAISYLSPGPEEATGKKEGGSRPRRRRRRGKSSQS